MTKLDYLDSGIIFGCMIFWLHAYYFVWHIVQGKSNDEEKEKG